MLGRKFRGEWGRQCWGYTLFELLVAIFLIGVLASQGLGLGRSILQAYQLESGMRLFVTHLSESRNLSISRNFPVCVRIHGDRTRFSAGMAGETEASLWIQLPGRVRFTDCPSRDVTFYSRGLAAPAGSFVLSNSAGAIRVIVALSGRIRWERLS